MKITIIVPVYNVEPYIEDCLKSVAEQTYKGDIECIIVDDCTPDGSCAIIERFINEYNGSIDFKLLHHTQNRGLSAARNTGIDVATGDYIYFLDSDDEITADCIELLTEPLKQKKYDFVIGDYETRGTTKKFPQLLLEEGPVSTNSHIRALYFADKWYMMAWNKLCNLDYIRKEELYFKEGLLNEDNLWSFQLACTAESMYVVKRNSYVYKVRALSIMESEKEKQWLDAYSTIVLEMYDWSKRKGHIADKKVFNKILYFRNIVYSIIFSRQTAKERKHLYLLYYKKMHINSFELYKQHLLTYRGVIREMYNYLPGILGFWYLRLYKYICKDKM